MRADNAVIGKRVYEFGKFRLNAAERVIETGGRPLSVTPKAVDVLIVLVENRGRIVEKEELLKKVWPGTFVEDNNLAFNVSVLRKLLGESSAAPQYIETVPKRGYRFIANVVEVSEELSSPAAPASSAVNVPSGRPGGPKRWSIVVSALVALAVIGTLTYSFRRGPRLTNKDTTVVADFINRTGDPVFDGTLRQELAIQLEQSPFLALIPERRIHQTLRLMSQPADARLTADLAREVCERTGSAAILDGSIASLGSHYVMQVRAQNCPSGVTLDSEQMEAGRKEDVLSALSQMARRVRARLGESLATVEKYDTPLAEATTGSLEALKAYSTGWRIHTLKGAIGALPFFRRATEIDPEFAMAHASLGRMYADLDESDLAAEGATRAWELRDRASEREKFFITNGYETLVSGNMEKAQQTCEAWAQTYPREALPHTMLSGIIHKYTGQYQRAIGEARKGIELAPDFAIGYYNLAVDNLYLDRPDQAEETLRLAAQRGLDIDEFGMLKYDLAFLKGDQARMEEEAAQARGRSGAENWISNKEAFALAYSGHLEAAASMSQRAVAQAEQASQRERAAL